MENSTVCNRRLNLTNDILDTDKEINGDEFVYMDGRSLKIVPLNRKGIYIIQKSLREELHECLKSVGRTSLAKRSIEDRLITYTQFEFLESQINKPRTRQALLNNIPQHFFTPMNALPNLVRNDMEDKGMTEIPSDITYLHCIATGKATGMHSLPLIKYLATQCMEIDFNSSFETLENEFKECIGTIFSEYNPERLQDTTNCVTTLNILRNIWKLQNPLDWNTITFQTETNVDTKPTKSAKNRSKKRLKAAAKPKSELTPTNSPKQPAHASPIAPSSEPPTSVKDTPIAEKTTEQLPSQPDKIPRKAKSIPESKPKTACPLPKTTHLKQTSSVSSQGARPKEATSSVSYQGAMPEEASTSSPKPIENPMDGIEIKSQRELNALLANTCLEVRQEYVEKEATIQRYIDNPDDENLLQEAKTAFNQGFWPPGRYFDLLTNAYSVRSEVYFINHRDYFVKQGYLLSGYPPNDTKEKKGYMYAYPRDITDVMSSRFHYRIMDGAIPTEALDRCFKDLLIASTGIIVDLVLAKTLKYFWGETTFNKYFEANKPLQLCSFGKDNKHSILAKFTKKTMYKYFKDIRYVEGMLYPLLNHKEYAIRDINGEYSMILALCTDAQTPAFCVPELFENANIPTIYEKLTELFNKEPHLGKIMDEESWNLLLTTFHMCVHRETFGNAIKPVSVKATSNNNSNMINYYSHTLDFTMVNKEKKFRQKKIIKEQKKAMYAEHSKEDVSLNTKKATPVAASPFFLPETPKIEAPSKPDEASILSTYKSRASGAIRKYGQGKATSEQVFEAFSAFETFFLPLKDSNPLLHEDNEKPYQQMKNKANKIRDMDII